jgi:hypothetical protein
MAKYDCVSALERLGRITMEIKDAAYYRMKADQHWEMAGLARQDNDHVDAEHHTKKAREYEQLIRLSRL